MSATPGIVNSQSAKTPPASAAQIRNRRKVPAKPMLANTINTAIWIIAMTCGGKPVVAWSPASTRASQFIPAPITRKAGRSIQDWSR